jgi:enoyl-CoA hydratase/carnithine racemase
MRKGGVDVRKDGAVLRITLNMPERLNVLDVETRKKIFEALEANEDNEDVKCVVFRAEGRAFSAGADLRYLVKLDRKQAKEYASFVKSFLFYIENYPKPTIGVVEGIAVGGGLELLLALDIVVASEDSRFGQTELKVGLIPGGGGTQRLQLIAGQRIAREMVFTSRLITASEAKEAGIVNRVVKKDLIEEELKKITDTISEKDSKLLALAKKAINYGLKKGIEKGLEFESKLYSTILASKEAKQAIRNFLGTKI